MTLDRPLWLALLLAAPVLWWLHRRLSAPREVVVASVEPLRGAHVEAAGRRPRRTLDVDLALLLGATLLLALSAAGLRLGGGARAVLVALDTSASMTRSGSDGTQLGDSAWREALGAISSVAGDVEIVAVDLAAPLATVSRTVDDASPPFAFTLGADDLPGALAPVLARARAEGFPGVLLVTDRADVEGAGVVLAGPPDAPAPMPLAVDAVLDGEDVLVTMQRAPGAAAVLEAAWPGDRVRWTRPVEPGEGTVVVRGPAPPPGAEAVLRVTGPGTSPAWDLRVRRVGGVRDVRLGGGAARSSHLGSLLATLGVRVVDDPLAAVDVEISAGGAPRAPVGGDPPLLHLAATAGGDGTLEVTRAPAVVAAERVSVDGVLSAAVPTPGTALARTGTLAARGAASGSWRGPEGLLAVALPRRVVTTLDPGAEASTWHRDPSFAVFVLAAAEWLAGGADRIEPLDSAPRDERVADAAPPPPPTADEVGRLMRPRDRDPRSVSPAAAFALLAAALVAIVALRGAPRFSGAARR